MKIYFFDTETTGATHDDRIVQLAIKERGVAEPVINELFSAPFPIPFESSAVHHISNRMVQGKPLFKDNSRYDELKALFESPETIVVAHNSAFDVGMLEADGIHPTNVICTYKTLHNLDEHGTFTQHKLQYMRYALDMNLDVPAHDALADVLVLEHLFDYLLNRIIENGHTEESALTDMMRITSEPMFMREITFGKHKGMRTEDVARVDPNYLSWLLNEKLKNPAGEDDWIFTLRKFVK